MQTQENEEKHLFPNTFVKNEESPSMCAVKQENSPIGDTCPLASPTFDSPVKRPLIDSQHEIATPNSKRIKQERDDPSFWANKERLLLSNKTSLQNIVSEVADSFESSNYLKSSSFDGFESSKRALTAENDQTASERLLRIAGSANELKTGHEKVEALAPTISCRKEDISVPSNADQVQNETTKPVLRPLKSKDSGISEGLAYDHNFFPKLVGVHSVLSPTPSSPEVESYHDYQQTRDAPWLKKLDENQQTHDSSLLQVAENALTTVSNENYIRHSAADKGHAMPRNTEGIMSRAQTSPACDATSYKRDVLESSKVHAQKTPRTLPMVPIALATGNLPDLSTDFSPTRADLSGTWSRQRGQVTESHRNSQSVAKSSAVNVCTSGLHEKPAAVTATAHAHGQDRRRRKAADSTSQLSPVPSQVSPRGHDQIYSSKQSSSTSSKRLKSVNMKEVVNIYRMAASSSLRKNQSKSTSVHSPASDFKPQESCDLLFSFTKPDGLNDLFLVINDEVFAVKRLDYKGASYLIHTDSKGKTSILAKLPEEEKWKLGHDDSSARRGQQVPAKKAGASDIASSGSKQSRRSSSQRFSSHHPNEASLTVTALQNSFVPTFRDETARDTVHTSFGQQQGLDGMLRAIGCQNRREQTTSLDVNEFLSESQAVHSCMQTESGNNRPISFPRCGNLNSERKLLLKQLLSGIRAETSSHSQSLLITNSPQSLPDGQQCFPSQTCADRQNRHQGGAVSSNARSTPRSAHASSNSWDNQQLVVNPNQAARSQGSSEVNVCSQEQYTTSAAESTYNGNQAFSSPHQCYLNKETVDEDSYGTSASSKPSRMNDSRVLQRIKLMNYIAHRLASKQGRAPSSINTSDCNHPGSRTSDVIRQTSNGRMATAMSTRATNVSTSGSPDELPSHQQCQRLMEVLEENRANANRNFGGVDSSSRKRTVEGFQVAQTATSLTPQSVIKRLITYEHEARKNRATTFQVGQQHPMNVDTTSDWLSHEECRSGFTGKQLLNDRMATSDLHVNQSRTVFSPVPSDGEVNSFIHDQEHKRPRNDTAFQFEQYFTNNVPDSLSPSSSNRHSFTSRTWNHGRSLSICSGQQFSIGKMPPRQNTNFNEHCNSIQFDEDFRRTGPPFEGESVSALFSGQRSCIDDASVQGTVEVTKPCEAAKHLDAEKIETDDEVVEIISPPSNADFSPYTFDVVNKRNDDLPMKNDAYKSSNSALRAELVKKIQATQERKTQEKVGLKTKYLNSPNTERDKKLDKASSETEVIVIDED